MCLRAVLFSPAGACRTAMQLGHATGPRAHHGSARIMRPRRGRRAGPRTCTMGEMRGDRPPSTSCSASECAMRSSCALQRGLGLGLP
jgi:hypothetical protein